MRQTATKARKRRLHRVYQVADQAERAKDHFTLFQAIRELAPKQCFRRIQLRSPLGEVLTPTQEADWMQQWFSELYQDQSSQLEAQHFQWPFTINELEAGLQNLPMLKALSPEYAPAPFWRHASRLIAQYLDGFLQSSCLSSNTPQSWSAGTLCFLPKQPKRTQTPGSLRPIALLEPSGKAVMGILAAHLMNEVAFELKRWPQFAYLQHRGCEEALHRVVTHCKQVQDNMMHMQYPIQQRARGSTTMEVCGGLILSLDLSKAFDSVNRQQLLDGLRDLGISSDLRQLLTQIYRDTSFQFWHKGEYRSFRTTCGIRQGCKAAPGLWSCFTIILLKAIAQQTSHQWVLDCATLFADDMCFHEAVTCAADLHKLMRFLGKVLDVLTSFKLVINLDKTVVLWRLNGILSKKLQKQYICRNKDGTFLRIPRSGGQFTLIRLVKHFQYLGTTISYHSCEKLTMQARIKASEKTNMQLHRWLHVQLGLSFRQKFRLWKQCVFACMKYGLIITGFTSQTLQMFDRACMKQIRRIFRDPPHLSRRSHSDFLLAHGLPDPLELLLDLNLQTYRRDIQTRSTVAHDDVILRLPSPDFQARHNLILEVWQQLRYRQELSETVQDSHLVCPHCLDLFADLPALRRHLTLEHDERSGLIRQFEPQDAAQGVPTCARCMVQFSTFTQLEYHVKFVCLAHRQDSTEIEHRVRVQEMLQFARARQVQAISANAELLAYFYTRCAICQHFSTTVQGLLLHWKTAHLALFAKHEGINDELLSTIVPTNPCEFCGQTFKQYHKCHLVRQMALLLAADGHQSSTNPAKLVCEHCGKAYTTRHGLQQHVRIYHEAEQASQELDEDQIVANCLIHEAVLHDRCEDLLGSEAVQFFLATQCLSCRRMFARKQDLKRHFKQNHGSEWNECERRAYLMDALYKPTHGCLCQPTSHQKHICNFYLQFALLRIEYERQQMPQVVATPPDMVLSIAEQIEPVLWLGYPQFLYKKLELRVNLTVQCQICGWSGLSAEELHTHLHALHADHLQAAQNLKALFQWSMFGSHGCFCNPGPGWGHPNHECVGLTQLAIIAHDFQWPVILPWTFCSTDLVQLLGDMLPRPDLQRICMDLMTRNFHRVWNDGALLAVLSSRCLLCQEPVDLHRIKAHLFVAHRVDDQRVQMITQQLCWIYADLMTDEHRCDWCNSVIPSYFTEDAEILDPIEHLAFCPMVVQMALLLMMPKWSSPSYTPFTWPRQEEVEASFRQMELKLWQFNARPSDTFGMDFELLAKCGLDFLQEAWLAESITYQCLLCQKRFFLPQNFADHLHSQHNFMQFHTLMCLHRLENTCTTPCQYCTLPQHSKPCLPLLNLAVFLVHGHGIRGGRWLRIGAGGVGPSAQCRPAPDVDDSAQDPGQGQQASQTRWRQGETEGDTVAQGLGDSAQTGDFHTDKTCLAPRRQSQCSADGGSISPPHHAWTRLGSTRPTPEESAMAWRGSTTSPAPCSGSHNDDCFSSEVGEVGQRRANDRAVPGLCQVPPDHHRLREDYAVPEVGREKEGTGTGFQARPSSSTGPEDIGQHPSLDGGHNPDSPLSCPEKATGEHDDQHRHSMVVDNLHEADRTVVRVDNTLLSQYLATHPGAASSSDSHETTFGEAIAANPLTTGAVRICLNTTGTVCFANSVILCLAWLTLLADGLHGSQWHHGYELMRNVTMYSFQPLDLTRHKPFLWLLIGVGILSAEALQQQQDACEFCTCLLNLLQPRFINCEWVVKPLISADWGSTLLAEQKGSPFTPILIPFTNFRADSCMLQTMIDEWHDGLGLCKGVTEVGRQLILMFDRYLDHTAPGDNPKCLQRIDFSDNCLHFPFFSNLDGTVDKIMFEICGVIYHIGPNATSGHYRAALRYRGAWLIYDDGRVPDRATHLSDFILRNCIMIWCVIPTRHTDRTMNAGVCLRGSQSSEMERRQQDF